VPTGQFSAKCSAKFLLVVPLAMSEALSKPDYRAVQAAIGSDYFNVKASFIKKRVDPRSKIPNFDFICFSMVF
jgi:hypothetical protein